MSFFQQLYLTLARMHKRRISVAFNIVLCTAAIAVFWFTMYLDATVNSGKKEINASIYGGMENCGVIWPTDLGTDKVSDCIGEISHLAEVKGVGSYNLSYIGVEKSDEIQNPASDKNYLTDILEIQNN